ncbi:hypothetical protein PMN64_37570, partial [Bradyrhizobium sp. UFLA01-814]|uniref:hypothetical protein n=1 Tax=Bradyrhizobium sp. UFLA01-814 TaxID=3023480 RepID=UPI00398B85F8
AISICGHRAVSMVHLLNNDSKETLHAGKWRDARLTLQRLEFRSIVMAVKRSEAEPNERSDVSR